MRFASALNGAHGTSSNKIPAVRTWCDPFRQNNGPDVEGGGRSGVVP